MDDLIEKKISDDFDRARFKSFFNAIFRYLKKEKNELLSFDKVKKAVRPIHQVYKGMKSIPLENIRGSEGRYRDFDKEFLPRQESIRPRWENIDKAHYENQELPPIQVYQIGDIYFVKDGNHRVSVAKEKGQKYIDAEIIELKAKVPLEKDIDYERLILKEEHVRFLEETKMDVILPETRFEFTRPGQYDHIVEQIKAHQRIMSALSGKESDWEHAVRSWYKVIYLPIKKLIKKYHILRHFPDLTEADLFMWIIKHWNYLRGKSETSIDSESAAIDLKETYSRKLFYRISKAFLKIFKPGKFAFLLLLAPLSLSGDTNFNIKGPSEPRIDLGTKQTNTVRKEQSIKVQEKEKAIYVFSVSVIFQDKAMLKGLVSFLEDELKVQYTKNNFLFRKTVSWNDVKSLQIMEWKPSLNTQESNARLLMYYFYPRKYKIIMESGETYYYDKNIPYINKLILTNEDGSTDIFSYFVDYWSVTGPNTGYWRNARSTYFYAPFEHANRSVIKKINFR
ncbi:MAG: hypothetical protein PHF84_00170 [bacterium]|nr:hypothetical protein [bacterium]